MSVTIWHQHFTLYTVTIKTERQDKNIHAFKHLINKKKCKKKILFSPFAPFIAFVFMPEI
jgi:hypothetical protein